MISASDWNRKSTKPGPWEGGTGGGAGGLDLADFAAAALKFRSEMADMKLTDGEGVPGGVEEDMMERLLREQTAAAGELGGALEDDDDAVPDWAMDTVSGTDSLKTAPQPQAKRSLLLETLNVKSPASGGSATVTAVKSQVVAQTHTGVGGDLSLHPSAVDQLLGSRLLAALPLLPEPPVEWFYTDPQGQVQGPFSQENMQLWHEAGYFSKDLPIKLRAWAAFHPFCVVFPPANLARGMGAFCGAPLEPQPPAAFPPMPALVANGGLALHEQQRQHQHQLYLREQQSQLEQRQAQEAQQQREQEQRARQRVEEAARQQHMASAAAKQSASGPPPLVAAPADKKAPQNAAAPVDPLRKIRISTNISELNAGSETAASQRRPAQQNQATAEPEPRKKSAASGPPPLVQDKGREGPAWAGAKESAAAGKDSVSLLDIQRIEKDRAERERMARETEARQQQIIKGKGWAGAGSAAGAAKLVTASLSDIQQEEARQRERQRAQQEAQQPAGAPLTMSSQLKSLLGVKTSGLPVGAAPAPKQWAAAGASSPVAATEGSKSNGGGGKSLREIMQQEQKQQTATPEGSGPSAAPRRQPLSWAAKAGTGVNATNLLPASITAAVQKDTAVRPVESAAVPVAKSAPAKSVPANGSGVSSGNDFGGHAMSREMSEWCSAQLRKITGSADDLSALMDFCVSLESASEIREYLSQYLGSSPQVSAQWKRLSCSPSVAYCHSLSHCPSRVCLSPTSADELRHGLHQVQGRRQKGPAPRHLLIHGRTATRRSGGDRGC